MFLARLSASWAFSAFARRILVFQVGSQQITRPPCGTALAPTRMAGSPHLGTRTYTEERGKAAAAHSPDALFNLIRDRKRCPSFRSSFPCSFRDEKSDHTVAMSGTPIRTWKRIVPGQSWRNGVRSIGGEATPFFKLLADRSSILSTRAETAWGGTKSLGSSKKEPFERRLTRKYFELARRRLIRRFASAATSYSSTTLGPVFCFLRSSIVGISAVWWDFPPSQALTTHGFLNVG